jgi:hypothetical protein
MQDKSVAIRRNKRIYRFEFAICIRNGRSLDRSVMRVNPHYEGPSFAVGSNTRGTLDLSIVPLDFSPDSARSWLSFSHGYGRAFNYTLRSSGRSARIRVDENSRSTTPLNAFPDLPFPRYISQYDNYWLIRKLLAGAPYSRMLAMIALPLFSSRPSLRTMSL